MIGRVFGQRPAAVCNRQGVRLAVVCDRKFGQVVRRKGGQRDGALRRSAFGLCGLLVLHRQGCEGPARQKDQNQQNDEGVLFRFHAGLTFCAAGRPRQHLPPATLPEGSG